MTEKQRLWVLTPSQEMYRSFCSQMPADSPYKPRRIYGLQSIKGHRGEAVTFYGSPHGRHGFREIMDYLASHNFTLIPATAAMGLFSELSDRVAPTQPTFNQAQVAILDGFAAAHGFTSWDIEGDGGLISRTEFATSNEGRVIERGELSGLMHELGGAASDSLGAYMESGGHVIEDLARRMGLEFRDRADRIKEAIGDAIWDRPGTSHILCASCWLTFEVDTLEEEYQAGLAFCEHCGAGYSLTLDDQEQITKVEAFSIQ